MNKKVKDLLKEEDIEHTDKKEVNAAIDLIKGKKDKKQTESDTTKINVPGASSYKEHEVSIAINTFLSENLDDECGNYRVGENAARTLEHYGFKGHPIVGLIIAVVMVAVHCLVKSFTKDEKKEKDNATV